MLTHTRTLSVGQKAGWGLADMGIVVFVIVKQLLVLSFLTNYLNVPVGIAGLLTTSVLIFDIITDPIVGYLSDRTQSRWGRRVPWMVIGALILSGGIIRLFGVPQSLSLLGTIIWVGGFFALATVGFTMVAIPYGATAGEMTQDPKERSTMMGDELCDLLLVLIISRKSLVILLKKTKSLPFKVSVKIDADAKEIAHPSPSKLNSFIFCFLSKLR